MYGIQRQDALKDWNAQNQYNSPQEQIKRLKAAGLNPALMYGEGGSPGGITAQTRGSAPGSWNPQMPNMGLGIAGAQASAQLELLKAQKENINADTKVKLGDAANKPIIGENLAASTSNLLQGVENAKAQKKLTEVQTDIAGLEKEIKDATFNDVISKVYQEQKIAFQTMRGLKLNNDLTQETFETKVSMVKAELGYILAQKAGIEQKIEVDKATVTAIIQKIAQEWQSLYNQGNDVSERMRNGANQRWVNDVTEQTKLSYGAVEKILQAIGIGSIGQGPSEIHKHYHNK